MSIIARIRPSVNVKPTRVSPVKPRPFGDGIVIDASPKPCPVTLVTEAVKDGRASWIPQTNGRGLSASEHLRMIAARNEAFRDAERLAVGSDLAIANQVGKACELATTKTLRAILADRLRAIALARRERFEPSWEDMQAAAQLFGDLEAERGDSDMEWAAQEAEWSDRMSGHPTDEDVARVWAVG